MYGTRRMIRQRVRPTRRSGAAVRSRIEMEWNVALANYVRIDSIGRVT